MTDPNAPQNVPSEQPTPVPPSQPPAAVTDAQQQQTQQPRYGELHPETTQQPWNQTGQQPPAPHQGQQSYGQQQPSPYGQPAPHAGQDTGQYGQPTQPQPHLAQPTQAQPHYGQPTSAQPQFAQPPYGQPQQPYDQAMPKAPNPRARETRLALVSVGIAAGIAVAVALVGIIGTFFSISEYYSVGDVLLGFGANLLNIALWGAGAALVLIQVRPLTRVRTARDLLQAVGIAAAVGTGVMLVVVLLVTIVRGIVEQYGSAAFFVNQGFLSPILYGVTLAGFLTIGAVLTTRFVAPEGLADTPRSAQAPQPDAQSFQQQGQPFQQQGQPFQQQPYQQGQQHNPYQQ